jgi:transcriptional regulator
MVDTKKSRGVAEQPLMTHEEIAKELGVSRAYVSDMEKSALRKIKKALIKRGIKLNDFFGKD